MDQLPYILLDVWGEFNMNFLHIYIYMLTEAKTIKWKSLNYIRFRSESFKVGREKMVEI